MNKTLLTTAFTALITFAFVSDSYAQNRGDRGNRGNGNRNSEARQGNGSRGGNSTARQGNRQTRRGGNTTTINRDRLRQENRDRMRRNNGGSSRNTTRVNTRRNNGNRNTTTVNRNTNRRNNGNVVYDGRRYNPTRNNRNYGSRYNHTPYRYNHRSYTPYRHQARRNALRHANRRYQRTSNYFSYLSTFNSNYIYRNWLMYPSTRINGYYVNNNYPYFVYNGYQHRYSTMDSCDYQLVDKYTDQVIQTFYNQTCSYGYDNCAYKRDQMNQYEYENRYFCAETYNNGYGY